MSSSGLKYISKLVGKRVLVLGGTSGIGFRVAEAALEHGAHVTVSSSNPERVANAVERLKASGSEQPALLPRGTVNGHVCDLSQTDRLEENLDALLKFAAGESGKINHVVFTAGDIPPMAPVSGFSVEAIQKGGNVRFLGTMMLAKALQPYVDLDPSNSFTLTGGIGARKPMPNTSQVVGYAGAQESLMRAFALDLKPLRVNLVEPGSVRTELVEKMVPDNVDAFVAKFASENLTGTVASPEDVAEAYIYLMKDKFVTGSIIISDGGKLIT